MGTQRVRRAISIGAAIIVGVLVSACAGAPVQEMSDARQAIRAAQNAGASQKAATQLQSAQALLTSAEKMLQKRMYRAAKRDAIAARNKAVAAMQTAGSANNQGGLQGKDREKTVARRASLDLI